MATETITLRLIAQDLMSGNVSKAMGSLDRLAKRGGLVGSVLQGVGQSMGQLINPVALVANGIGMVTDALGDAQTAYREDQASQAKLKAALEANIEAWDGNTQAIEDTIAARMKLGFSDDEQRASLALLVSQVEDVNDALAIQRTAMDLARLKNMNLADASTVLAKAYLGSGTALQKMGIRLKKGTDGMDAIAAVQQRAAGQAEAWSKTSVGAAEAFDVKVGELEEKIGEFVDGAGRGFIGFLSGVVDVIDGPDGVEKSLHDVATEIYRMGSVSQAATQRQSPIAQLTEDLQRWKETLQQGEGMVDMTTFDWLNQLGPDTLRNFGKANTDVLMRVAEVAHAVRETGGDFSDFARVIRQQFGPAANVVTSTWGAATESLVEDATEAGAGIYGGLVQPTRHAFKAMFATMADAKDPWRSAWKSMAEWAKDPFRPGRFENWLGKRADRAIEKAQEAARDGRPKVAARWRALAAVMRKPVLAALADTEEDIQSLVDALMIIQSTGNRTGTTRMASETKVAGRASGGYVAPGGSYRVGESGKTEQLRMFRTGGGYVSPGASGPTSAGGANVSVTVVWQSLTPPTEAEGARLARHLAPHLRREMARAGG